MPWLVPALVASLANSSVIVIAYAYLAWIERDPALRLLTLGWILYSLRFAGMLDYVLSGNTSILARSLDEIAAIISSAVLFAAVVQLAGSRIPRWIWLVVIAGLGWVAATLLFEPPFWLASLPVYFITGVNFICLGVVLYTARKLPLAEARFTGVVFILLGLHKLDYPLLRPIEWFAPWGYMIGAALGLFGALGIVLCYLQLERRKTAESHRNYRNLVESSPYPIFVHRQGRLVFANQGAADLVSAAAPQQLIGHDLKEVLNAVEIDPPEPKSNSFHGGEEREFVVKALDEASEARRLHTLGFDIEFEDGPARLVYCRDVTEKRLLQHQLRQHESLRNLGTLAGGIAHDFNNMLMAIQGFTEIARDELPPASRSRDSLQEVLQACRRASSLIRQILRFSRREEREARELEIAPVIREALKLLRASLPSSVIFDVQIDARAEGAVVVADSTALHQIMMNLCTNAHHAMAHGGMLTTCLALADVSEQQARAVPDLHPGKYVRLSVSDTGSGIPPDVIPRIFEPFYTTKTLGDGTGLGLSLVHSIVESFDGAVTVHTELGQGTTFSVYLPLVAVPLPQELPREKSPLPNGQGRVLVVDDEQTVLALLLQMVERLGYEPVARLDGRTALDEIRRNPGSFRIVLTDLTMPHLGGVDLAREISHAAPDLPVVILTGYSDTITPQILLNTSVKAVLSKPVTLQDVASTLAAHCREPVQDIYHA